MIKYFHFHLYYEFKELEKARELTEKISKNFEVPIGKLWDRPVGPHPIGSCQVSVPVELFQELITWLLVHREGIDFFIHPVTGDDLIDHRDCAIWLGKSYPLDLTIFR